MRSLRNITTAIFTVALTGINLWIPQVYAQNLINGEKIYEACVACHSLSKEDKNTAGPSLFGVFGRQAGSLENYRFSPAMKRSGITWDKHTLDTFLSDPQKAIPANRMPFDGVMHASDRLDLIALMQSRFQ